MRYCVLAMILAIASSTATGAITVVNESSLVVLPDSAFTATFGRGQAGPELVVAGTVSGRTTAGERVVTAELNFVATDANGTVVGSGISSMGSGNRFDWRVLVKPVGMIDGNLVAQIKLTDREVVTAEREEREAHVRAEATRQADLERERLKMERNKPALAADCIAKSRDPVGCFVGQVTYRFLNCKLNVQLAIAGGAGDISSCSIAGDRGLFDFYTAALRQFAKSKTAQSMTKDYYAFWRTSMGALMPSSEMTKGVWIAQTAKLESELTQKGERLQLEK